MIISISGKIGSGKDTVAEIIKQMAFDKPWEIKKWAGKLKEVATILTGIPVEKFEDQEFKQTNLGIEWNKPIYLGGEFIDSEPMTVRDLLQLLGTEAMRNGLHTDTWVNALMSEYQASTGDGTQQEAGAAGNDVGAGKFWLITDTRFPNELAAVKRRNGIAIRVVRDSGNRIGTTHSSETALDSVEDWDFVIENDGSLMDLRQKVYAILTNLDLMKNSSL